MSRGMIFGAVGAVIGFVAGGFTPQGAYYGYVAGSALGALTAPTQRIEGPRIETTPITGAAEGDPIPTVIVNGRPGGDIAWCSPKRPVPHTTEQSKGGGVESTTYTSEWDMLIIVAGHRAAGVRRIWRLGKVVYSAANGADAQTLADSQATDAWRRMTVYTGGPDQMPDPVYEAFHGAGNVSAHRNVTSVFIEGYQSDFGGQYIPLSFEVVEEGDLAAVAADSWVYTAASPDPQTAHAGSVSFAPGNQIVLGPQRAEATSLDAAGTGFVLQACFFDFSLYDGDGNEGAINWGSCNTSCLSRIVTSQIEVAQFADGGTSLYDFGESVGINYRNYAINASRAVYCSGDPGTKKLYLFARAGGPALVSSAAQASAPVTPCILGSKVFAIVGTDCHRFDLETLASETSFALPSGLLRKLFSDGSSLFVIADSLVYRRGVSAWESYLDLSATTIEPAQIRHPPELVGDRLYWLEIDISTSSTTRAFQSAITLAVNQRSLADVITQLTEQTGLLTANDIDVTDIEDIMVRGMVITQPTTTRAVLEKLLDAYLVEPYEDDRIVYRKLGGDPVVTIPYRDLGASEGGEFPEPLPIGLRNDIEVPARIRGKFGNVYDDFQVGLTAEGDRLTTDSLETRIVDLGLMLTPLEAARVIDVKTAELTVERRSLGPIVVTRKYAALKPTNVILVENHDGSTYRARIAKITDSGLLRTLELRPDDASTINSAAEADETDYSQTIVRNNAPTEIEALDTPAFRDADLGPGHYERIGAVGRWDGARFQVSQNDTDWSDVDLVNQRATYGVAASVLQDFDGGNVFDERSSLTVTVRYGEFSSTTAAELIASRTRNLIVVGAQGREEALQFRTATPLDATTVRLAGFLRGRFGTEHAMASHQVGDHVVLMQPAGIVRVDSDISAVGATRYYRAISFGKLVSSANSEEFVNGGACLRPYSAANPRVVRDASGNAVLSCHRRTRATGRLFGPMGSAFPLGEATESWLWEIYSDDTYTTVLRELSSSISEAAYSAAQQTTDFGSPQAVLYGRAYLLSESVGRGYPLEIAA